VSCAGAALQSSERPLWLLPIASVVLLPQFTNCTLWISPSLSSFDMHVRPTLAVNMLTAALVGELSCCGRIWASCSGCLSEVCTATLVIFHCWWNSRTCGAHRQSN
jgi:hypothetical protein